MTRYTRRTLTRSLIRTAIASALILAAGAAPSPDANAQTYQWGYSTPRSSSQFGYDTNERFIRTPTPLPESNFQINVQPVQPYTPSYIPSPAPSYSPSPSYSSPSYSYDYGSGFIVPGRD